MSENKIKRVVIQVIPHSEQRYPTAGDWIHVKGAEELDILVSDTGDWRESMAVAIHELTEALCCVHLNIPQELVDEFDIEFEKNRTPGCGEPGDSPSAPYFLQHQIATDVEKIFVAGIGLKWQEYDKHLDDLEIEWGE